MFLEVGWRTPNHFFPRQEVHFLGEMLMMARSSFRRICKWYLGQICMQGILGFLNFIPNTQYLVSYHARIQIWYSTKMQQEKREYEYVCWSNSQGCILCKWNLYFLHFGLSGPSSSRVKNGLQTWPPTFFRTVRPYQEKLLEQQHWTHPNFMLQSCMTKLGPNFVMQHCKKGWMRLSPMFHKTYLLGMYPDTPDTIVNNIHHTSQSCDTSTTQTSHFAYHCCFPTAVVWS